MKTNARHFICIRAQFTRDRSLLSRCKYYIAAYLVRLGCNKPTMAIPASFEYSLPVIRGIQARREYYIAMCPVRLLPKLFPLENEKVPPQARSQRQLDRRRVPKIARYILDNPDTYTTAAIAVSIDGDIVFEAIGESGDAHKIGRLRIPMDSRFIINDGQHRMAALQMALQANEELADETIALVLFVDTGLGRSQQRFSDLNRFVVRPPNSLNILYDRRDPDAEIARQTVDRVAIFRQLTETERNTLPKRSPKLFTLSGIYQANVALLSQHRDLKTTECIELVANFWERCCQLFARVGRGAERKSKQYGCSSNLLAFSYHFFGGLGKCGSHGDRHLPGRLGDSLRSDRSH